MQMSEVGALDNLLAGYVAGSLPTPVRVMLEAHLEISPTNRPFVQALEQMAGNAIEEITPVRPANRDKNLIAIFGHSPLIGNSARVRLDAMLPASLRQLLGCDVENIPWQTKMPGYREHSLGQIDGFEANMLWIKAGRKMPSHTHEGTELTLVLDGAFSDANGRYGRGDIAVADESVDHRPIAEEGRACICFAVTDAPLRLTGSFSQMFSDLLGR